MILLAVLEHFKNVRKSGSAWTAICPAHDDQHNSLSISEGDDGKILLKCHAACSTKAIIYGAGLTWRDLFPGAAKVGPSQDRKVIDRYVYTDEQSQPLFRVCRTEPKGFFQERYENNKWVAGLGSARRVLYRLPEILTAETLYLVEGEKDANKLHSVGLPATTSAGGAGKWQAAYSGTLKGKNVVILPDNDAPGRDHALKVARSLHGVAKSVKIVSLPNIPEKGDVSEFLTTRSKEDLLALVKAAPPFVDPGVTGERPNSWPEFLSAKTLLELPADPQRWIWNRTLPAGGCSILVSKPKIGKSTLAINLCLAIARGLPFLGRDTQQAPVAYLSLDASLPETAEIFQRFGLCGDDPIFLHAGSAPKDAIAWLAQRTKEHAIRFVVIDTLQRLFRFQDLNAYSEVTNRMEPLLESARQQNCHLMLLHHAKKGDGDDLDASIGSTAIRGLAYSYLFLKRLADSDRRILRSDQRGGENFEEVAIRFNHSGWLEPAGTREEAEIEEVKPKVIAFVEAEGGEIPEKDIRQALPFRTLVISKAIRDLVTAGLLTRSGDGKRGKPFRYTILTHVSSSFSVPRDEVLGEGISGTESKKTPQLFDKTGANCVPKPSGTEWEQKGTESFLGIPGTESLNKNDDAGIEAEKDGDWEVIP